MKSATWSTIVNGAPTADCGVFEGKYALTFSGKGSRYAETTDMDVSSGGWVEAEMFISPIGFDVSNENCKTSYGSYVEVEYSTNFGRNWTSLQVFNAFDYRQAKFFPVKFNIPTAGISSHTRFRFMQHYFEDARDAWGLDNVRVFRNLPGNWRSTTSFNNNLQKALKFIQFAQCCFDTDWCESRLSDDETAQCDQILW